MDCFFLTQDVAKEGRARANLKKFIIPRSYKIFFQQVNTNHKHCYIKRIDANILYHMYFTNTHFPNITYCLTL